MFKLPGFKYYHRFVGNRSPFDEKQLKNYF